MYHMEHQASRRSSNNSNYYINTLRHFKIFRNFHFTRANYYRHVHKLAWMNYHLQRNIYRTILARSNLYSVLHKSTQTRKKSSYKYSTPLLDTRNVSHTHTHAHTHTHTWLYLNPYKKKLPRKFYCKGILKANCPFINLGYFICLSTLFCVINIIFM
jgi:hypothetical protein